MKRGLILMMLLISCAPVMKEEKPKVQEERPQDVYREKIRADFEEFLKRAKHHESTGK